MQLISHPPQRLQRHQRGAAVRRDRHGKAVDHNVFARHAVPVRRLVDAPGDGDPALRRGRNSVFVQHQRHQNAAILANQWKYRFDALFFAIDGVDHGLAVVETHTALEGSRVGGVDLQRQTRHALQLTDHFLHHGGLIDLGQTHVDVQNMCPAVLLLQAFLQNVFDVFVAQRLLELLLPRRIDALADDDRLWTDLHALGKGGDKSVVPRPVGHKWQLPDPFNRLADVLRCCAAAASHHLHAKRRDLLHEIREFFGSHIEHSPPALGSRQACVGIDDDRHTGDLCQTPHDRQHLGRAHAAVDPERIHAQPLEQRHDGIHRPAGQELALLVKSHRNTHRKIAVLLCCQHRCFCLIAVGHRLDQHKVRPRSTSDPHNFPEQFDRPLKSQIPQRLQQLSGRSDIQRNIGVFAPRPAPCLHRQLHRRGHDLFQLLAAILERIGSERIRVENVTPRCEKPAIQIDDIFRSRQIPPLRQLSALEPFRL